MRSLPGLFLALLLLPACGREPLGPADVPGPEPRLYIEQDNLFRTFDPTVELSRSGRHLFLTVLMRCTPVGDSGQFRVVVTQEGTDGRAAGLFTVTCSGELETWQVTAHAVSPTRFAPGEAIACAELTEAFGDERGRIAWCRTVNLRESQA